MRFLSVLQNNRSTAVAPTYCLKCAVYNLSVIFLVL